jgi:hypothetical protein
MLWRDDRLNRRDFRVLCALQGRAFKIPGERRFEPVRATLSDLGQDTSLNERRVRESLRRLERFGLVKTQRWPGRGRPSAYDLSGCWMDQQKAAGNPPPFADEKAAGNPPLLDEKGGGKSAPIMGRKAAGNPPPQDIQNTTLQNTANSTERAAAVRARLIEVGIGKGAAAKLVREFSIESIEQQLEWLPHRKADNPAGMLIESIRGAWPRQRSSGRVLPSGPEAFGEGGPSKF